MPNDKYSSGPIMGNDHATRIHRIVADGPLRWRRQCVHTSMKAAICNNVASPIHDHDSVMLFICAFCLVINYKLFYE
jgi:RNA:NAD 2'-phosphotransferase (TPT1/KptA family)